MIHLLEAAAETCTERQSEDTCNCEGQYRNSQPLPIVIVLAARGMSRQGPRYESGMCGSSVEPGFTLTLPLLHPLRFPGHTLIVVPPVRLFVKMRLPLALGHAISYAIIYKDPGHSYPNG